MESIATKKIELIEKILKLSDDEVLAVDMLLNKLFPGSRGSKKHSKKLQGIWANKGFEKIEDLEAEIASIRKALGDSILKKETKV